MASRSLGTLTLDLAVKIGAFAAGMSQAERAASKSLGGIEKRASAFARTVGNALGLSIAGLATGAVVAIDKAIDRMDEMRDASIRLGIGVETLAAFGYAAEQTGTNIDALGKGFKILAKNMADALKEGGAKDTVFDALGIKVADAQGQLKDFEQIIPEIANAFAQLEDGAQKAALAQELFGKSGLDLIEFLNQGADGIVKLTEEARELGLVFDQEAADNADLFNDTLAQMKGALGGIALDVASQLLPTLIELAQDLKDVATEGEVAGTVAYNLQGLLKGLSEMAQLASGVFKILGATFRGVGADLAALDLYGDATQKAFRLDIEGARESIRLAKEARKEAAQASAEIEEIYSSFDPANRRTGPIPKTPADSLFQVPGAQPFSAVPFSAIAAGAQSRPSTVNRDALAKALAGITPGKSGGGAKKSGKSDVEKEAEAVAKAIKEMTDAQREWQTELDGTGNQIADDYARRLDEITEKSEAFIRDGVPTEKVAAYREEMTKLAEGLKSKETTEFLKEFAFQTEEMIASANGASTASTQYARAIEELDVAFRAGIIGQDEYIKRAEALAAVRDAGPMQVLRDIELQQQQLGMTAEAQDTYNKLLYAGVDANSAFGQAIIAANEELWNQSEAVNAQLDVMDLVRESSRNFLSDLRDGLREGADGWDILKDAIDNVADALFDMVAKNLVERALGQDGSTATGSAGGLWGKVAGWLAGLITGGGSTAAAGASGGSFVGPRAIGGQTIPFGLYPVNEHAPELLTSKGKTYLMMGSDTGQVKPIREGRERTGGGDTYNFNFTAREESQSRDQAAAYLEFVQRRDRMRSGRK